MYGYVICDHMRALHVYLSALNGSCPLRGVPCPNYEDFLTGQCVDCDVFKGTCPTIGDNTPRLLSDLKVKSFFYAFLLIFIQCYLPLWSLVGQYMKVFHVICLSRIKKTY